MNKRCFRAALFCKGQGQSKLSSCVFLSSASASSESLSSPSSFTSDNHQDEAKDKEKKESEESEDPQSSLLLLTPRERRKKRLALGLAKAIDRGLPGIVTYQPGGPDGTSFVARSGVPFSSKSSSFVVLGIESSCDDTGAAVVTSDGKILGEALASQSSLHEPFGGIVPSVARDAHQAHIERVIDQALHNAGLHSVEDVDAIGVTVGPGLEICLRVGCQHACALALRYQKPFVAVHHLEAHILMARMPLPLPIPLPLPVDDTTTTTTTTISSSLTTTTTTSSSSSSISSSTSLSSSSISSSTSSSTSSSAVQLDFPFLALLVSGGHCQLLKCLGIGRHVILGGTVDDSLGEAFDKVARLLGLTGVGGGGGPAVEALAARLGPGGNGGGGDPTALAFRVPLSTRRKTHDYDFSYSGLKSQVRRVGEALCRDRGVSNMTQLSSTDKANIAASFQHVAIQHIEQRLKRAMILMEQQQEENNTSIRQLAVVGGVAANQELRKRLHQLCADRSWQMIVPPPRLCTDQGVMSAWATIERLRVGSSDDPRDQEVYARYPFAAIPSTSTTSSTS